MTSALMVASEGGITYQDSRGMTMRDRMAFLVSLEECHRDPTEEEHVE